MYGWQKSAATENEQPGPDEIDRLRSWRCDRLIALGVPYDDATYLADVWSLSWHTCEALIRKGCPPAQVARIVI